jgi:hypothetical protein
VFVPPVPVVPPVWLPPVPPVPVDPPVPLELLLLQPAEPTIARPRLASPTYANFLKSVMFSFSDKKGQGVALGNQRRG